MTDKCIVLERLLMQALEHSDAPADEYYLMLQRWVELMDATATSPIEMVREVIARHHLPAPAGWEDKLQYHLSLYHRCGGAHAQALHWLVHQIWRWMEQASA